MMLGNKVHMYYKLLRISLRITPPPQTTITQCKLLKCQYRFHMCIPPPPHTTTTIIQWPPPQSAGCLSASAAFAPVAGRQSTTNASCRDWCIPPCVPVDYLCNGQIKRTTSASWNWWQSPPAYTSGMFAQLKHHKRKVQRSGAALALVGTGYSNNMQLQPPSSPPRCK